MEILILSIFAIIALVGIWIVVKIFNGSELSIVIYGIIVIKILLNIWLKI